MDMRRFAQKTLAAGSLLCAFSLAEATVVVVDFDAATQGAFQTDDYTEEGFRLSVNFPAVPSIDDHYDIFDGGTGGSNHVVNDSGGSYRVEFPGGRFDLLSFEVIRADDPGILTSSAGGLFTIDTPGVQAFSGLDWLDLAWIDVTSTGGFVGLDTLTFDVVAVPAPASLWLLTSGVLLLYGRRRASPRA